MHTPNRFRTLVAVSIVAGLPAAAQSWSRIDIRSSRNIVLKSSQVKVRKVGDAPDKATFATTGFLLESKQSYLISSSGPSWNISFYYADAKDKADMSLPSLKVGTDTGSVKLLFQFPSRIPKGAPQDFPSVAANTKALGAYREGSSRVAFLTVGVLESLSGGGKQSGPSASNDASAGGGSDPSSGGGGDPASQPDPNS